MPSCPAPGGLWRPKARRLKRKAAGQNIASFADGAMLALLHSSEPAPLSQEACQGSAFAENGMADEVLNGRDAATAVHETSQIPEPQ